MTSVVKLIRPPVVPVRLVRTQGETVKLIQNNAPVRLVMNRGPVFLSSDGNTDFLNVYNLAKQS